MNQDMEPDDTARRRSLTQALAYLAPIAGTDPADSLALLLMDAMDWCSWHGYRIQPIIDRAKFLKERDEQHARKWDRENWRDREDYDA